MKKFTFLKTILPTVILLFSISSVQAETITITGADMTTTDGTQSITKSGIGFDGKMKQYSTTKIWFTSGTGYIYNTSSLGSITKITLSYNTGGSASAVQRFNVGSSAMSSYMSSGGTTVSTSTGGTTYDYTGGVGYGFFNISVSSKNLQLVSLVIEYTPSASTTAPAFTPAAGTYSAAQSVTISNGSATDKIYYTTDGSAPTSASTLYTGAINVATTTTIKTVAYDSNNANPSAIVTALYTINIPTITVTETSIPEMAAQVGGTDSKTITVSGIDLTANINLAITGADAAMFSVNPNTLAPVSGVVSNTLLTITYAPTAAGNHSATLEVSSAGAQTKTMPLSGVATVYTGIISNHLDANAWAANGNVMFNATAGERVEIFNSLGQKVVSSIAVEGLNKVSVAQTGMLIVKVSNRLSKVML